MNLNEFLTGVSIGLAIYLFFGFSRLLIRYKIDAEFRMYSLFSLLVYVLMIFTQLWALSYLSSALWPLKAYVVCVGVKGVMGLNAIRKKSTKKIIS